MIQCADSMNDYHLTEIRAGSVTMLVLKYSPLKYHVTLGNTFEEFH